MLQIETNDRSDSPNTKKGSPLAQWTGGEPYM